MNESRGKGKSQQPKAGSSGVASAAFSHWWQHPLVLVAWSVAVMIGYTLVSSTDTYAVVAEAVWIFGVIVWMIAADWRLPLRQRDGDFTLAQPCGARAESACTGNAVTKSDEGRVR